MPQFQKDLEKVQVRAAKLARALWHTAFEKRRQREV